MMNSKRGCRPRGLSLRQAFHYYMGETPVPPRGVQWLWQGGTFTLGYGQLWFGGKYLSAHRVSWQLFNGEIPRGLIVRHRYDNPPDVNPNNLELGTYQQNMDDMILRGRCKSGKSVSFHEREEIKYLYGTRLYLQREIAQMYGVSRMNINNIIRRK